MSFMTVKGVSTKGRESEEGRALHAAKASAAAKTAAMPASRWAGFLNPQYFVMNLMIFR